MGLWSTIKGWFNIGGVKVEIIDVENPFPESDTLMSGKVRLTTSTDKTLLGWSARFFLETTYYEDGEEKTETRTVGEFGTKDIQFQDEFPCEIAEGEEKVLDFTIFNVDMRDFANKLAEKGGLLGAAGKAASMIGGATKKKGAEAYYVEVTVDVKGTPFDPSDRTEITVVKGK